MPLCTLSLISLNKQTTLQNFISSLYSWKTRILTISRVIRWIIIPSKINKADLLEPTHPYDLLLIYEGTKSLPGVLEAKTHTLFTLQIGIPSRLIKDFPLRNKSLLHPESIPNLTGSLDNDPIIDPESSQTLTLSPQLHSWIKEFSRTSSGKNAVSMLNLLCFEPGKKDSYLEYGKAFAESIGSKRGGDAKLVGHVVYPDPSTGSGMNREEEGMKWDEFALAQYPSIMHFADMLASGDYQDVNQRYRVPALRDTCILCTSEVEVEELMKLHPEGEGGGHGKAKL